MKKLLLITLLLLCTLGLFACESTGGSYQDVKNQLEVGNKIQANQPIPTDLSYSLERYNLIRRAYWVNGQREKAISYPCPIVKPLGYIVLFLEGIGTVGRFIVDGKVSYLTNYLTPISEYYEAYANVNGVNKWLADVDGTYGDQYGIFFFTTNGNYIEWTGTYIYSDIPFEIQDPVLKIGE